MKIASKILYIVAVIFAAISAIVLIGLAVFCIVNVNNSEIIDMIANKIIELGQIEEEYQHYVFETMNTTILLNGICFAIAAIPCVIAIPIFLSAKKELEDINNSSTNKFIASIIFGVLSTNTGIAAGVLALLARHFAIRNNSRNRGE